MLKAIIIDDERSGRELISHLLTFYCQNVQVVAEAESVNEGVAAIAFHKPEIVFLDIKIQGGTGLELLKKLNNTNFKIIFISASEEYILKASEFNPVDYILKPLTPEYIIDAVKKVKEFKHVAEKAIPVY